MWTNVALVHLAFKEFLRRETEKEMSKQKKKCDNKERKDIGTW